VGESSGVRIGLVIIQVVVLAAQATVRLLADAQLLADSRRILSLREFDLGLPQLRQNLLG
jgi:hypothetical protein